MSHSQLQNESCKESLDEKRERKKNEAREKLVGGQVRELLLSEGGGGGKVAER